MALDSRAHLHSSNNTSFFAFGGSSSSSDHHQTKGGLSLSQLGFHGLVKGNDNQYHKLHQQAAGLMMQGGIGKVLSDSNDGSLISFEDSYEAAAEGDQGYKHNSNTILHAECFGNSHLPAVTSLNNHIVAEDGTSHLTAKVNTRDDTLDYWFHLSDATDDHTALHKHPSLDESCIPPNKKQCTSIAKKSSKAKQPVASKDPQSIAAKNRRERISERLKILQELVPNGTKVDLVTMLEKAISYVKFLQLQVKVLAADEFWPVQGGKAPELSQVKDAIDAILSSQRSDRSSTSG